jgi:hypothetical protein
MYIIYDKYMLAYFYSVDIMTEFREKYSFRTNSIIFISV